MFSDPIDAAKLSASPGLGPSAWIVAALLTVSMIGLVHDLDNATALGAEATEAGRNIESQAEFQHDVTAARPGRMAGFACLLLVGAYCAITVPPEARFQWNGLTLLTGIGLVWACASVAWSVDPHQTARELVRLFGFIFAASMMAWRFDSRTLCLVLTVGLAGCVAAAIGVEILTGGFQPWVPEYRLTGSMHSNAIGTFGMLVGLSAYAFARNERHRLFWCCVFTAAVAAVVLCKARTSLITLAAGLLVIHYLGRPRRDVMFRVCLAASLLGFAVLGAATVGRSSFLSLERIANMGRDGDIASLTGRLPLWSTIWDQLQGRRLEGFGYGAYWVTDRVESFHDSLDWYPHHAHSAYLQTLVDGGIVGLALLLAVALLALRRAAVRVYASGSADSRVFAAWLVAAFINGFAEVDFVTPSAPALCGAAVVFSFIVARAAANATTRASNSPQPVKCPEAAIAPWSVPSHQLGFPFLRGRRGHSHE